MTEEVIELAQILWDYHRLPSPLRKSDAIIGLGSYDIRVAEHGANLLAAEWAPRLIFTGAEGNFTRGKWAKSEAETFADVALAHGATPDQILIESRATNTGDNIRFTKALCEEKGLTLHSAILVTKPNMNRRAHATCRLFWPDLDIHCSAPDTHFFHSPAPGHTPEEVISEIVGDFQRILEYPALGYQTEQPVPPEVLAAYQKLIALGFTNHLL
jgi:uncharacterized SAM-binding protein YcdF (DUF218 family)